MKRVLIVVALLLVVVLVTGCCYQKRTLYQSEKILVERDGSLVTITDLIGGEEYEIRVARQRIGQAEGQTSARMVVSGERLKIQAVYNLLIVTIGDDDPIYIRL